MNPSREIPPTGEDYLPLQRDDSALLLALSLFLNISCRKLFRQLRSRACLWKHRSLRMLYFTVTARSRRSRYCLITIETSPCKMSNARFEFA